jgi:iron-sulfur cluster repair protein YtfE (RIC family)
MKDLLISDHLELDSLLEELFAAFDKGDAALVFQKLDFFWARLAMHIRAEHLHLFPAVLRAFRTRRQSEPPLEAVESSINNLHNDHDFFMRELGTAVKELFDMHESDPNEQAKRLAALREKIQAVRLRLERHNELEETGIYEWAEMLNAEEIPVLNAKIQRELGNLPPRFQSSGGRA